MKARAGWLKVINNVAKQANVLEWSAHIVSSSAQIIRVQCKMGPYSPLYELFVGYT